MNIPPWVLEVLLLGVGTVVFFGFRHLLKLIDDNKVADEEARKAMMTEVKDVRTELHARMSSSEDKITIAIKDLTNVVVPKTYCNGRQDLLSEKIENLNKTIEVAGTTAAKADVIAHTALSDTLLEVCAEVKQLKDCVTKLANKGEC